MRQFIRHPAEIPLRVVPVDTRVALDEQLRDISSGGLSFHSETYFEPGTSVRIDIKLLHLEFSSRAVVVWCEEIDDEYDVGVRFEHDEATEFHLRMAEQVCHIVDYWHTAMRDGRYLSLEQAALEWIQQQAADFPH